MPLKGEDCLFFGICGSDSREGPQPICLTMRIDFPIWQKPT